MIYELKFYAYINWALINECIRLTEYVAEKSSPLSLKQKNYIYLHTHDCQPNIVQSQKNIVLQVFPKDHQTSFSTFLAHADHF